MKRDGDKGDGGDRGDRGDKGDGGDKGQKCRLGEGNVTQHKLVIR